MPSPRYYEALTPAILAAELGEQVYGDIFTSSLRLHGGEGFEELYRIQAEFQDGPGIITSGRIEDGNPVLRLGIAMSIHRRTITPRLRLRTSEALGGLVATTSITRMFILAHEIGHCIQERPGFSEMYGGPIEDSIFDPDTDSYADYLRSDSERNADYAARFILGNTPSAKSLGMPDSPSELPPEWRVWATNHPLTRTITRYGNHP